MRVGMREGGDEVEKTKAEAEEVEEVRNQKNVKTYAGEMSFGRNLTPTLTLILTRAITDNTEERPACNSYSNSP